MREQLLRALADSAPEAPLEGARVAAIALVLLERDGSLDALLIERAQREGDPWSGHIALPGGHVEPADVTLQATAERETFEEVGLDLKLAGERMGRLSDCAPVRGVPIAVRPFVYLLQALPVMVLNAEVRRALWVPVSPLLRGERRTKYTLSRAGQQLEFPAWDIDGSLVWGLTYRVLAEFLAKFSLVSGENRAMLDNSRQPR
ncbi:MAG: CoA pyrophosphatase [Myxococcales bacterium]|jgi:8-oxo-dGTP pyrophosphatase MutT (NUDIX family)